VRDEFLGEVGLTASESTPWWADRPTPPAGAPNVVLVVLDDTGFAHLGCFGSDIDTPNIDRLATNGLRFTNFHTTALCSPTRAALLTGRNHHSVGMRFLSNTDTGFANCRGRISPQAGTAAELLSATGYATFALGKWHLANMEDCSPSGPMTDWPLGRGFDRFYGFLGGATDQFSPELVIDNRTVEQPSDDGYHLSEALVDEAISMITSHRATSARPFFAYLAFGATHSPHQAPPSFIEKYRGRYDRGWDIVRAEWFERQRALGVVPEGAQLSPRNWGVPAWDDLDDDARRLFARMQEVFAGFLDHVDAQIGRLTDFLAATGELDNTLLVLVSDNGASQEGGPNGVVNELAHFNGAESRVEDMISMIDDLGGPNLYNNYPMGWAQVGNTPFRFYKQNTYEGGVRDPMIVHWPNGIAAGGGIRDQYHHVIDVLPTILEVTGVNPPPELRGVAQLPIEGVSMRYCFDDANAASQRTTQYFEMLGHRAIYHDGWKAVTLHLPRTDYREEHWSLYNLQDDFAELHDRSADEPERLAALQSRWHEEAERFNVLPLDDRTVELFGLRRPGSDLDRSSFTFRLGTARIDRFAMPELRNRSWQITAEFAVGDDVPEGVLVAGGARTGGYSFFLQDGAAHFAFNRLGKVTTVSAPLRFGVGETATVAARFRKTGEYVGTIEIVQGDECSPAIELNTLPFRQTLFGLLIGSDEGSTVTDAYPAPFRFTGRDLVVRYEMSGDRADAASAAAGEARAAISEQ
jgi:arylsulfatase A-like enzyme